MTTMSHLRSPLRPIRSSLSLLLTSHPHLSSHTTRPFSTTPTPLHPDLTKRAVVGSFLLKRDASDDRPRVALFRRTDKVNTYKGKFATISGGIEPTDASPLDAARRELLEETTLDYTSPIRLLCTGRPYSFVDRVAHYEWDVHPFAFKLLSPEAEAAIRLGWEHEDTFQWFEPDRLPPEGELAAGIQESLRRVWPEGPLGRSEAMCRYLLRDEPGASTEVAFLAFKDTVAERLSDNKDEWWRLVRLAAWHVYNNTDDTLQTSLLSLLVPSLDLINELVSEQNARLAEGFETLAAMAVHDVVPAINDPGTATSKARRWYLAGQAESYFNDLWTLPE